MESEIGVLTPFPAKDTTQRNGFVCFCGEWFPTRELFDIHLKRHPDKSVVCKDCGRILPKGSWRIDEEGNFVSLI